ncbi:MAG: sugar phosphate isomerase/epimerase family protein [Gaiellales bacterium]
MEIALIDAVWEGSRFEGAPGLRLAREIGFDAIEVAFDPLDRPPADVDHFVRDVEAVGLPVRAVICVSLGIGGDYNPAVQRFHVQRAKRHLELGERLGAGVMLFVIGEHIWQNEIIPAAAQWDAAVRNVREVAEHAAAVGLTLALELEHWRYAFLNSIPAAIAFVDDVGVESCKVNLDLNHLWAMRVEAAEIASLAGRISHAHISDCHGERYENLPPGRGTAPLADYLAALAATGYDGTLSLELEPSPNGGDVETWVREGYTGVASLLEHAGVERSR